MWRGGSKGSLRGYEAMLEIHVERLFSQGVVYAELMIGSSELPDDPEEMTRFREWLTALEGGRIQIELLLAVSRVRSVERNSALLVGAKRFFDARELVGVAIAGWPEDGHPVAPLAGALREVSSWGAGVEIHAGEWAGAESVRDAIDAGAKRIGHGVGAFDDERLIDMIASRGIHVEMCPTSNLKTGSIEHIEDHPIARAKERGVALSINSDDPGAFSCSVQSEHELVRRVFGFDDDDFARIDRDAWRARFASETRVKVPWTQKSEP